MNASIADLQDVTGAILGEIQGVMGLARSRWAARLVNSLFGTPARRLADRLVRLDDEVARYGLSVAAGNMLSGLIREFKVHCRETLPREGPLLVASNHTGAWQLSAPVCTTSRMARRCSCSPRGCRD